MKNRLKKMSIVFVFTILILFVSIEITQAVYFVKQKTQFAGTITASKATEISILEKIGYVCVVLGKTIQVGPYGFFIPAVNVGKGAPVTTPGKQIIGNYLGKTTIVCILPVFPPVTKTVVLDTIAGPNWGTTGGR